MPVGSRSALGSPVTRQQPPHKFLQGLRPKAPLALSWRRYRGRCYLGCWQHAGQVAAHVQPWFSQPDPGLPQGQRHPTLCPHSPSKRRQQAPRCESPSTARGLCAQAASPLRCTGCESGGRSRSPGPRRTAWPSRPWQLAPLPRGPRRDKGRATAAGGAPASTATHDSPCITDSTARGPGLGAAEPAQISRCSPPSRCSWAVCPQPATSAWLQWTCYAFSANTQLVT